MSKHRDRHQRGMRGPRSLPNPLTGTALWRRHGPDEVFMRCVSRAVAKIGTHCPQALTGIDIGVDDVPAITALWTRDGVPLAAALDPAPGRNGQIVVYRRPLELRAHDQDELTVLIFRTIVEQLASITGYSIREIDPTNFGDSG